MKKLTLPALGVVACMAMAACSRTEDAPSTAAPAPAPAAEAAVKAPPPRPDVLKADMVDVKIDLASEPVLDAATSRINIPVRITNNGKVALSSELQPPVRIGVQILGDDGTAKSPGAVRDFVRTTLPRVEPGQSVDVTVSVPMQDRIAGRRLDVELVQESVAWFSSFGQAGLQVGPFARCDDALCK